MIEAGAVPALTALLGRAQPDGQYAAAAALYNLTGQQAAVRTALLTLPALPHLVHMLQADSWSASSSTSCLPPLKAHVLQFQFAHICVCVCVPACAYCMQAAIASPVAGIAASGDKATVEANFL